VPAILLAKIRTWVATFFALRAKRESAPSMLPNLARKLFCLARKVENFAAKAVGPRSQAFFPCAQAISPCPQSFFPCA
jgi:hypothetical protein